jgi:hypothetical protein
MKKIDGLIVALAFGFLAALPVAADEHPGREFIEENGYDGPSTCEQCHEGKAKEFLNTVHWKHASPVTNVEGLDPSMEYGMKNRIYTMCNGNDVVNNLKEIPVNPLTGKSKFTGCNTCHPGNHLSDIGSTGPEAEAAVDCLVCHSSKYNFRNRAPFKDAEGRVVMGQDRSVEAALAIDKPSTRNCMVCHESAGGGIYVKRGFEYTKKNDVHAAKGMTCVDCHKAKNHRMPTGTDPNTWANDGLYVTCNDCHGATPHEDEAYDRHIAKIACQTCHIPRTGGTMAKDFTKWEQGSDGFYEPSTILAEANTTIPAYAWYNHEVTNAPHFIGPKGNRTDGKSRIYPFKVFQGKAFFDKSTGELLSMDFAPPMSNGDALAGVASAASTLGIKSYDPVPGWQTLYFASSHLVTKDGALTCFNCHTVGGVLNFKELGYSDDEIRKLTNPEIYFEKALEKQKDDW